MPRSNVDQAPNLLPDSVQISVNRISCNGREILVGDAHLVLRTTLDSLFLETRGGKFEQFHL